MYRLLISICILFPLVVSIHGCSSHSAITSDTVISPSSVIGEWEVDDSIYILDMSGQLTTLNKSGASGDTWKLQGNTLILNFLDSPANPPSSQVWTFKNIRSSRITLENQDGLQKTWEKSSEEIVSLQGEFFILERMALPPEVTLRIRITQDGSKEPILDTLHTEIGNLPIKFSTYYEAKKANPKLPLRLSAVVYYKENAIFSTAEPLIILQGMKLQPIRLVRAMPEETAPELLSPPLAYSYFHKTAFRNQHSAQLYLEDHHLFFLVQQAVDSNEDEEYITWGHWNQIDRGHSIELLIAGEETVIGTVQVDNSITFDSLPHFPELPAMKFTPFEQKGSETRSFSIIGSVRKNGNTYEVQPCGLEKFYPLTGNTQELSSYLKEGENTHLQMLVKFLRSEEFHIEEIIKVSKTNLCNSSDKLSALQDTYWRLTHQDGKNIIYTEDAQPHLIIRSNPKGKPNGEGGGSDGCNTFFFNWEEGENSALSIALGGSTMRLCPTDIETQAREYLQNLAEVNSYSLQGSILKLKKDDTVLATFEAVEL